MANWTYVKAELNFDSAFEQAFKDIFGKIIDPEETSKKEWKYALEHPNEYLPVGTNGSLVYALETYGQGKYVHATIRGNLEDYDGDLIEWFISRVFILDTIGPDGEVDPKKNNNVIRAVISVDSDALETDHYSGLQVWQVCEDIGRSWANGGQ